MKKIILTESQITKLMLFESSYEVREVLKEAKTPKKLRAKIKELLIKGFSTAVLIGALMNSHNLGYDEASSFVKEVENEVINVLPQEKEEQQEQQEWVLLADDVLATVYNAVPSQCNDDITHTASMFRLNLEDVLSHRIIAMERTMMAEYGLKYGDIVRIEGTGKWDGEWQIQDTMNKRFKGMHKIDILIPKSAGLGQWNNVKVYRLNNPSDAEKYKKSMAPQLTKAQAKVQIQKINYGKHITV